MAESTVDEAGGLTPGLAPEAHLVAERRKRRLIFYGSVLAIITVANSPVLPWLLGLLQFNERAVAAWSSAVKSDTLSLVALLILAGYLDFVARKEEQQRWLDQRHALVKDLHAASDSMIQRSGDTIAQQVGLVTAKASVELLEQLEQSNHRIWVNQVLPALSEIRSQGLEKLTPRECLESALSRGLGVNPAEVQQLNETILGRDPSFIIRGASYHFTLTSIDAQTIQVRSQFTQQIAGDHYRIGYAHTDFTSESKLLTEGLLNDAWILRDDAHYFRTLSECSPTATLTYRNSKHVLRKTSREFFEEPELTEPDLRVMKCDLSRPDDAVTDPEMCVSVKVFLPARPSGFRWFFDSPIYVKDITFDVTGLWPDRQDLTFALYPFLLGTEDYTTWSPQRRPTYRINVNSWLFRGHGVFLNWES